MVACRVILAVAVVLVAVVQIHGRPGADTEWGTQFTNLLSDINKKISDAVGENSEYSAFAKSSLNTFGDLFNAEYTALSKALEGKAGVSDVVKESTKQWQTAMENVTKNLPKEVSLKDFNEKSEQALKYLVEHATEVSKKVQGYPELQKDVQDFTKKMIDSLIVQARSIQAKVTETKKV